MILARIKEIIDQQFIYEGKLNKQTRIIDDLGADSFDIPVMINALEDEFDVIISDEELIKVKTIGDIINIIQDRKR